MFELGPQEGKTRKAGAMPRAQSPGSPRRNKDRLRWEAAGDTESQQIQEVQSRIRSETFPVHSHVLQLCRAPALAGLPSRRQAERSTVPVFMDQMRHTGWTPPAMSNLSHQGENSQVGRGRVPREGLWNSPKSPSRYDSLCPLNASPGVRKAQKGDRTEKVLFGHDGVGGPPRPSGSGHGGGALYCQGPGCSGHSRIVLAERLDADQQA